MKKSAYVLAIGTLLTGSAYAQTSVTLYGIVDQSVRFTTNASPTNANKYELTNGAITNSRWGVKGSEALGNNLKAIFQLEGGFDPDTGRANQNNSLFGRQAYVGLAGDFGTIKFGRQYTEGFNFFGDFDPLTIGNYNQNAWPFFLTRFRNNNVVSYDGKWAGLNIGASYGFGETPGSVTSNQYWGTRAAYTFGPFAIGGVYQEIRDAAGNRQQMWGASGKYSIGPAKIFLGYVGGKDRTGQIDTGFMNDPDRVGGTTAAPAILAGAQANPRKDAIGYLGATYNVTPALALTGAFYYDDMSNKNSNVNVGGIAGGDGKRYTGVIVAEYSLSKRTQVYGTVDYNKVSGAAQTELPGKSNQLGVAAGMRHIF
jgi:predicted porin